MNSLDGLRVVPLTRDRAPNDYPGGNLPWQVYHTVRNAVVQTCRRYGPTGPAGVIRVEPDVENPHAMLAGDLGSWERGDPDPVYFVLDNQLNHERYLYAELYGADPFNPGWLLAVTETLRQFDGWGLGVGNIPGSYILIFGRQLMVNGRLSHCKTPSEVAQTSRTLLKKGEKWWRQFW